MLVIVWLAVITMGHQRFHLYRYFQALAILTMALYSSTQAHRRQNDNRGKRN
jgi:hypothetical protein